MTIHIFFKYLEYIPNILKKKYPLKIFVIVKEGKLYLKKYDSFEEMLKERKIHKKKSKQ